MGAMQKKTLEEFSEMSRSIKEKSDLAENKLNESLEIIQSHTKSIEALQETSAEVSKNKESCETQLQKMEFKVSSCVEELAKMDQFAKVTDVRKLEKALADKSGMTETVAIQNKLAQLSQETQNSLRDLATRHGAVETALTTVQTELAKVSDVSGMVEDVSTISGKVNQQKAKLIDIEANVALQERSNTKLSEDVRKIGTDFTGNLSKMEERMDTIDSNKKELGIKMSEIEKANSELSKEMASLTGLKTKVPIWDRKADCEELDKLNLLLTEEVNRIQKEIKDVKKRNEEIQAQKEEVKEEEVKVSQEQFKDLDTNFSRLSDIVENMQCRLENHQENNSQQIEQVNTSIKNLRKGLDTLSHESKQSGALNMIDKQRRGWEEAREKAEQMSQIFDSLIITNDRPYVSCGLESPASCPGLLDFSQFELINKVGWDSEDLMFTILEPGVYMLQMGGNLCGASVVAKMVNEDVEAEVVTLEGGAQLSFRSRSTIFTVEDDDQAAERLLVEVVEQGEEDVRVEKDFSLLLYKISEVSQAEGPECLQGDFIKA